MKKAIPKQRNNKTLTFQIYQSELTERVTGIHLFLLYYLYLNISLLFGINTVCAVIKT